MDAWMDRWIFTGRDSTCMGDTRTHTARARESTSSSIQGTRSSSTSLSLSPYTNPTHTHHARTEQSRTHARPHVLHTSSSHDSWMSPRVAWPRDARPRTRRRRATPHDARTHHDFRRRRHEDDDESDVLLFARLSRRVDHRKQRCRSEAGASDARENERAAGRMECARARGGARWWWWCTAIARARDDARVGMTTRNDGCGEINFFLKSRGVLGVDARGVTSTGGVDDGSIARSRPAPRIRARGGEG